MVPHCSRNRFKTETVQNDRKRAFITMDKHVTKSKLSFPKTPLAPADPHRLAPKNTTNRDSIVSDESSNIDYNAAGSNIDIFAGSAVESSITTAPAAIEQGSDASYGSEGSNDEGSVPPTAPSVGSKRGAGGQPLPDKRQKVVGSSNSSSDLEGVSKDSALATVKRLVDGHKDKSGAGYGPAIRDSRGCLVAQKKPNRAENGYIQIKPISSNTRGKAGSTAKASRTGNGPGAHRLVVLAHGTAEDVRRLREEEAHASHRCHNSKCVEHRHIRVETKEQNEARKECAKKLWDGISVGNGGAKVSVHTVHYVFQTTLRAKPSTKGLQILHSFS